MNDSEEQVRLNKVRIIIDELGLTGLTDIQDQFIKSYCEGKNGLCEKVIDELIATVHEKRKQDFNNKK